MQYFCGDSFAFFDETEQDMLRADVVVIELARFLDGELQDFLGAGG